MNEFTGSTVVTTDKAFPEQVEAAVKMHDLLCCASDAAFALDTDLRVVDWNRSAERLLGYAADEVAGRYCREVFQAVLPGGEPLCGPACQGGLCFSRGLPFAVKACRVRHRSGHWMPLCIGSIVMRGGTRSPNGGGLAAIVLLRDSKETPVEQLLDRIPRIFTFGRFGIVLGNEALAVENWARKHALTLLKYLVTHAGNEVHRERLMECLWPGADDDQARGRLKVAAYFLRNQFRRAELPEGIVTTTAKGYALSRGAVWLDAEHFQQLAKEGASLQHRQRWQEALRCCQDARLLYRGDYLEEDVYADWCAEERERLRETFLDVLARIAGICAEQGRYGEAIEVCREALTREPCRENFHRTLMSCMARTGRHDEALAQYRHCQRTLAQELGVAPMPETQRLYQDICARADPHSHPRS